MSNRSRAEGRGVAALLRVGGRSTRMGRDKAVLDWNGTPRWRHQLETLRSVAPAEVLLSIGRRAGFDTDGEAVTDDPTGAGQWRGPSWAAPTPSAISILSATFRSRVSRSRNVGSDRLLHFTCGRVRSSKGLRHGEPRSVDFSCWGISQTSPRMIVIPAESRKHLARTDIHWRTPKSNFSTED